MVTNLDSYDLVQRRRKQNREAQRKRRNTLANKRHHINCAAAADFATLSPECFMEGASMITNDQQIKSIYMQLSRLYSDIPPVIQLQGQSFHNAVLTNALRLGYALDQLDDECQSDLGERWVTQGSSTKNSTTVSWESIPQNIHPSPMQLVSTYHPFVDFSFPWASVRDRLIQAIGNAQIDEDEICADMMCGGKGSNSLRAAFLVWGSDTMDPDSFEVGEEFAQKYSYLFDSSILRRTNWWRKQRGLPPLKLDLSSSDGHIDQVATQRLFEI